MKKFARVFDEFFPTEESTPNAALTGSNGADEVEQAVFELLEADFSKSGKAKTLRFAARQTRSQMRQNRLGPSSPVALSSCSSELSSLSSVRPSLMSESESMLDICARNARRVPK